MEKYIIVTNSFGRPLDLVERSLRASLAQNPPPQQLVLIDQNSPPLQLSKEFYQAVNFVHQKSPFKAVSEARNQLQIPDGVKWILFCDDDGFLDKDYVFRLEKLIAEHLAIQIFAGSIRRDDNGEFYSLRHQKGGTLKHFFHLKLLMGSNVVVSAEVFDRLGRFDETFGAGAYWGSSEETDFAWKAYFHKIPMEFFPELIVYHVKPYAGDLQHSLKKAFQYGVGKGALVMKWLLKGKMVVLLELIEMFFIPWVQMIRGLLTNNLSLIPINLWAIAGRLVGIVKYLIVLK